MNFLYFAPIRLFPLGAGNISRVHDFINHLKRDGHIVHYVYLVEHELNINNVFISQKYVDTFDYIIPQNINIANKNLSGYNDFDSMYPIGLGEEIKKLCKLYNINAVICSYVFQSKLLDYLPENIIKIIDTHDKMTDRHISLLKNNIKSEFFSCTYEDEAKYLSRADFVISISNEEKKFFAKISNNVYNFSYCPETRFLEAKKKINKVGLFLSANNINLISLEKFVDAIENDDEVKKTCIKFYIYGDIKRMLYEYENKSLLNKINNNNIIIRGFVEDLVNCYKEIDAVINPCIFGTGINIKTIEALSFGLPFFSTKYGMRGLDSNYKFHIASNNNEIIKLLVKNYNNSSYIKHLSLVSRKLFISYKSNSEKEFNNLISSVVKSASNN